MNINNITQIVFCEHLLVVAELLRASAFWVHSLLFSLQQNLSYINWTELEICVQFAYVAFLFNKVSLYVGPNAIKVVIKHNWLS